MRIISTDVYYFKRDEFTRIAGDQLITNICDVLTTVEFANPAGAVQARLSTEIINALHRYPNINILTANNEIKCSPNVGYKHDGVVTTENNRIGLEVQFRPDFLKDICRFQLGYYSNRIQAGVYIVGKDRNTINRGYTSMPGYRLITRQLPHFYDWLPIPIAVIGINGDLNQ